MGSDTGDIALRRYEPADERAVLALLQASLGWVPDEQYGAFFAWKHRDNPFGPSRAWVATEAGRIVGFRTFLSWKFTRDGTVAEAVRAVDTATHPDVQGRGIFSRLTLHALDELRTEGVQFVFNTPNGQSRPGYLKMGWQPVARLPVLARLRSPLSVIRLARARVPADKWSQPTGAGERAPDVLADADAVSRLLAAVPAPPAGALATNRTPAFLAWRYGFEPLAYRVLLCGRSVDDGIGLFRLRRRGTAVEAAICDVLVPGGDRRLEARAVQDIVRRSGADYGVRIGNPGTVRAGSFPAPGQGPTLVWRSVVDTQAPAADRWRLTLGDIELF
ncbi:MAG: hypothetical protein QOJ67_3670 [Acidimicrobiaceae bacterium]